MTEQECLAAIEAGDDAYDMINRAMPTAERRFKAIDRALRKLLEDVREHFPDAEYYTASGGFHLLLGKSHANDHNQRSQQQLTALDGLACIGDGDF